MFNYIAYCDILGSSPILYTDSKPKFKTFVGGLFSIIYFLIALGISIYFILETLGRKNYQVVYNEISSKNASYDIKENPIVIGALNLDGVPLPDTILTYKAKYTFNFGLNFTSEEVPMIKCRDDLVGEDKLKLIPPDKLAGFGFFWCFDPEYAEKRLIKGSQSSENFGYYNIYPIPCNNATSNNTCEPAEKIAKLISQSSQYMGFYDYLMDHDKVYDPGTLYIKGNFLFISLITYYKYVFRFRNIDYFNDYNMLFSSLTSDHYYTMEDYYIATAGDISEQDLEGSISSITLWMSDKKPVYHRTYEKLQTTIASISGVIKVLFILAEVLEKVILKNLFYQHLINSLMINSNTGSKDEVENENKSINEKPFTQSELRRISAGINGISQKNKDSSYISKDNYEL
jgi:hypothetical protein